MDTVESFLAATRGGPTAADFRAAIARHRLLIFHLASLISVHPSRLSRILNERAPLTPDVAERLARAIEQETRE
jgi:plasmid maintenance system antidote protein VapI